MRGAAEYAAYTLNRSPTRSHVDLASPIEVHTSIKPKLTDIVIFGSPCTVIRTPKHKTLDRRREAGLNIGKSDEVRGYRVLFTVYRVVRTTQHVQNIKKLREEVNAQLTHHAGEKSGSMNESSEYSSKSDGLSD